MTAEEYHKNVGCFVASFEGIDDIFSQTVQANHVYRSEDIEYGAQFVDMVDFSDGPDSRRVLRHENLSKTTPVDMMHAPLESAEEEPVDDLETE